MDITHKHAVYAFSLVDTLNTAFGVCACSSNNSGGGSKSRLALNKLIIDIKER